MYTYMCACVRIDALMDGRMDDVWIEMRMEKPVAPRRYLLFPHDNAQYLRVSFWFRKYKLQRVICK